jgi:hypothetical protein
MLLVLLVTLSVPSPMTHCLHELQGAFPGLYRYRLALA